MRMLLRATAALVLGAFLAGVTAGCGRDGAESQHESRHKIRSMSDLGGRSQRQATDDDARAMWALVRNIRGVADMDVRFSGADAYVTLVVRNDLQPREIPSVEKQVATTLRFHFPRYVFHMQTTVKRADQGQTPMPRKPR